MSYACLITMDSDIPDDWRQRDVSSANNLASQEKETTLNFPNDTDEGTIYTDVPTIIKWIQSVEASEPKGLHFNESGKIVGAKATIPKGIIKLQKSARKSNGHGQMVSYGDMK